MNPKDFKDIVYKIIGAAMTVHTELGWGLLEHLYREAMAMELKLCGINSEQEVKLPCYYKGQLMEKHYQADLIVGDILLELKSVSEIEAVHRKQLFNYMRITKKPLGLLINFGNSSLQGERYVYLNETNQCHLLDKEMNILYKRVLLI